MLGEHLNLSAVQGRFKAAVSGKATPSETPQRPLALSTGRIILNLYSKAFGAPFGRLQYPKRSQLETAKTDILRIEIQDP